MKAILVLTALMVSNAHATTADITKCTLGSSVIETTYQPDTNVLTVDVVSPGTQETFAGVKFSIYSAAEVKAHEGLVQIANLAHVDINKVDHAAYSLIASTKDGDFILVKYVGANDRILGIAGINGMTPYVCQ